MNTPGSSSLHHAVFLGAMGMRLGWVKLPGISIFSYRWLQPLEHLSSWKTMELTRLIISLVGPQYQHQAPPTKPSHLPPQPSPLSCAFLRHSPSLSSFCVFWQNPATMATAVSDRPTHTHNAGADASEVLHYQILLLLSPINSFNPVCSVKPLVGLQTSLLCCCLERHWKNFQIFYCSCKATV